MKISRQVKPNQIENFMKSTNGLTQTAQTSGGVLFTSWLEKDSNGPIMARSDDTLPSSLSNDQDFNDISTDEIIDGKYYLWQYRLWSFQGRVTKLERFLAKNHLQSNEIINFYNRSNGKLSKIGHHFRK